MLKTRRLSFAVLAAASLACSESSGPRPPDAETIAKLTITARPATPTITPTVGYSDLGLETPRDGFMYVPASYSAATAAPLLVLLHGASGNADFWQRPSIEAVAEQRGLVILAIESRYTTWDGVLLGRYDVDVAFLNEALEHVFARVNIDPLRVAIGGFSDGATEALGIGIANAGLFRRIIAYTPSNLNLIFSRGNPSIFLSHGYSDETVPFSNSRNWIVPVLRGNGMPVAFYVFEGGHGIPAEVENASFNWLFDLNQ